jgi:hypothetical protein
LRSYFGKKYGEFLPLSFKEKKKEKRDRKPLVYTVKKHYTGINIFFKKSQVKHD